LQPRPDNNLKVLSLVSYKIFPPQMGGQKGIALFNRYFSKHVTLTCVTTQNNTHYEGEGYEILPVLSNSRWRYANPLLFFKLRRIIRQKKITHLLMEHPYYGWLGVLLKWFCRVKLIVHSHNIEGLRFKSTGKWWWGILWNYEKLTHRLASFNFFIQDADREYALKKFRLKGRRCATITYGFELAGAPSVTERAAARKTVAATHGLNEQDTLLLFNGTLDYLPNQKALDVILETINPVLASTPGYRYKILICGKNLPPRYDELKSHAAVNIAYAGFVNDISVYFKAADIFLNPVIEGGGIKTKLVEALGYNLNVVTTKNGAVGVPEHITGGNMQVVNDGDWAAFTTAVLQADIRRNIPDTFFEHFYWGKIAERAADVITQK
jgi:polysaccharide biosynthesis protein PslH